MLTPTRACFVTLIAVTSATSQSRSLANQGVVASRAARFPTGTYTTCAQGVQPPSGNVFLNTGGFRDGARLTLDLSGDTVKSTYVDADGLTQSLDFSPITGTFATISRGGQVIPGFRSMCVKGPGRFAGYSATMSVVAGALTYDRGFVFLMLSGDLRSEAGECGTVQSSANFWLSCGDKQGRAAATAEAGSERAPVSKLSAGRYSCSAQVEKLVHSNGRTEYVTDGGNGTLVLAKDGAKVITTYTGDPSLTGTLRFDATTSTAASLEDGQAFVAPCFVSGTTRGRSGGSEVVAITSGALAMIDSTLFMSFRGEKTESSSCPTAEIAASVMCSRR